MIPPTASEVRDDQRRPTRRRAIIFRTLTIVLGIATGLAATEVGFRMDETVGLGDRVGWTTISDPELTVRILPNTSGHDANGFRNASVRSQVDIVVLGDSQTWGVNVHSVDAWPQQLERISGRPVYNMAVGGYGPVQYWMLTDQAISFAPKDIVVGLYFGNDIYDAYALAYSHDTYADLRSTHASDHVKIDTVKIRAKYYWDEEKHFHDHYGRSSSLLGWSFWLRVHSAIGRRLNRAGLWPGATDVDYEIDRAWARTYPDHGVACEHAYVRTVLTPAYRLVGLDFDDPRVTEGLRITKEVLWRTQQKVNRSGIRLVVLLIPTKELVYAELLQPDIRPTGTYARLIEMENRARTEVASWCAAKRIACVDALPNLRHAIIRRQPIYPSNTESHPNAAGYGVLAATVSAALNNAHR